MNPMESDQVSEGLSKQLDNTTGSSHDFSDSHRLDTTGRDNSFPTIGNRRAAKADGRVVGDGGARAWSVRSRLKRLGRNAGKA